MDNKDNKLSIEDLEYYCELSDSESKNIYSGIKSDDSTLLPENSEGEEDLQKSTDFNSFSEFFGITNDTKNSKDV